MAISRGFSSIAIPASNNESHFRPRSFSRSNSQSSDSSFGSSADCGSQRQGMPIHSRRPPFGTAPPALPPPQYIEELDRGQDIGYDLEHNEFRSTSGLPPIPEGSSLRGGSSYTKPEQQQPQQQRRYKKTMDVDQETGRRFSSSKLVQPAHADGGATVCTPRMVGRGRSPTNTNPMLQGELPLAQESHNRSNRDYDHAMLSKIGKPNSPPRPSRADSSDSPVLAQKLSLQTKDVKPQRLSGNEPSSAVGSVSQWIASPSSTGISPGQRYGWQDQGGHRTPPFESSTSALVLDPELFVTSRSTHHQQTNGPVSSGDDGPNQSSRNSYDHTMYTSTESENPEESDLRGLNINEPRSMERRASGTGMKRKALSPPGDRQSEERPRQDIYPLRMRMASTPPTASHPSAAGSISSAASSAQPQSYISSGPFSAAASSMTSMSSLDQSSPRDQSLQTSLIPTVQQVASPISTVASWKAKEKLIPRKLSVQTAALSPRPTPTRIGNNYICACCPKKPKKFETKEQLMAHENEKQYSCNFCHNRFKNKNEAERHQNSLHLRRHSWSCVALANYHAAFSPSGAVDSSSTATDACGYCGEEFSNHPAPDWDQRLEHLTNVHKFGECNSAKKFYRADHFRQHLKHSHAGRSGKWTNILEHACVRDEIPTDPAGFPVTAGDHNPVTQTPTSSSLSGSTEIPISAGGIRGVQDDDT